jgi:hypothetical protein
MKSLLFILIAFFQNGSDQRALNVYAKSKSDKYYLEQMKVLNSDPKGIKVRDIRIREHFGSPAFKITLTGKDGMIKLSSKSVLKLQNLYDVIDAMPMRKAEMSRQP